MKHNWVKYHLNALCNPKQWPTISARDLLNEGYPVYGANGLIGYYSDYNHEDETILITCRGATCGTINISAPRSYITGNAMCLDGLDKRKCDIRFIYYALIRRGLNDVITGSAQPQITRQSLDNVTISLPPLEEQKRIAVILDKADAIRWKRQQAIKHADDFLRATFLDMFGDPITNPKGWPVLPLEKVGKVSTGTTPSSEKAGMFGGNIPFITPGDLENGDEEIKRFVTEEGSRNSRIVRKGSTLVCCIGATIGKIGIAQERSAFNQQINAIEWYETVNDLFGFGAMSFLRELVIERAIKTTLPILKKSEFEKINIPVPPPAIQAKYAKIFQYNSIIKEKRKSLNNYSNILFNSLTQRAFRGEL